MQTVVETPTFIAKAKASGVSDEERLAIVDAIANAPEAGDVIQRSGGARKVRVAGRGKGKSGGYRVITYFGGRDIPVFILTMLSKGERANLSDKEINELSKILAQLADTYRKGVRNYVKGR